MKFVSVSFGYHCLCNTLYINVALLFYRLNLWAGAYFFPKCQAYSMGNATLCNKDKVCILANISNIYVSKSTVLCSYLYVLCMYLHVLFVGFLQLSSDCGYFTDVWLRENTTACTLCIWMLYTEITPPSMCLSVGSPSLTGVLYFLDYISVAWTL